jgi:hypothetical protein
MSQPWHLTFRPGTRQEDVFIPTLSVEETLRTAIDLRFGAGLPAAEKQALLQHWLGALGLTKVAASRVREPFALLPGMPCLACNIWHALS